MIRVASFALLLLAFVAAWECASGNKPPQNTDGSAGAAGGAGATSGVAGGAGAADATSGEAGAAGGAGAVGATTTYVPDCPDKLPANAGACAVPGRTCSYGTAPRAECRDRATCAGAMWAATLGTCKPPSPAAECPATAPAAQASCTKDQQLCEYPDGKECVCFAGAASKLGWICDSPRNTGNACPVAPPNAGTVCAGATSCTYLCGLLTANAVVARCVGGAWVWDFVPCAMNN